jgi:hypothetical protein
LLNIELKWSRDGILSEYLTLVSGFFTRQAIPDFSLVWRGTGSRTTASPDRRPERPVRRREIAVIIDPSAKGR